MFNFFRKKSTPKSDRYTWKDFEDIPGKEIQLVSKWGELRRGKATLYGKKEDFVNVLFHKPLILGYPYMGMQTTEADFRIDSGCRIVRIQGSEMDVDDWKLVI